MKDVSKKLTALTLCVVFAAMPMSYGASIDTGLGAELGGAVIKDATEGLVGVDTSVPSTATLNFNANTQVNWKTLNVNTGETLNFNAVDGASGLTVLNTVSQNMSKIYGNINANSGISNLIISNPNGILFDGAKFTAAGDTMITAQGAALDAITGAVTYDPSVTPGTVVGGYDHVRIQNSDFSVGGEFNIIAPKLTATNSFFNKDQRGGDIKFTTTNGQDYWTTSDYVVNGNYAYNNSSINYLYGKNTCPNCSYRTEERAMTLGNLYVNGDLYLTNDKGTIRTMQGGEVIGNLDIQTNGGVGLNLANTVNGVEQNLHVTGDTNIVSGSEEAQAAGYQIYANKADFDGDLNITNKGGRIVVEDINVGKDMNLTTTGEYHNSIIPSGKYDEIRVRGDVNVGGNANINANDNLYINFGVATKVNRDENGCITGYEYGNTSSEMGTLNVDSDLNAKTESGNIYILNKVNVGNNVSLDANSITEDVKQYNSNGNYIGTSKVIRGGGILGDNESVISAKTYEFEADGYIGALNGYTTYGGETVTTGTLIASNSQIDNDPRPSYSGDSVTTKGYDYLTIGGGTITKLDVPETIKNDQSTISQFSPSDRYRNWSNDVYVNIKSLDDLTITGANANNVYLNAPGKQITITGPDVHANTVYVNNETDYLKLDFESRDFDTEFINIKDDSYVWIDGDQKITWKDADGGNNLDTLTPDEDSTYLFGPEPTEEDLKPEPTPEPEPEPTPEPEPEPTPEPEPEPTPEPEPAPTPEPEPQKPEPPKKPEKPDNNDNVRVENWVQKETVDKNTIKVKSWVREDLTKPLADRSTDITVNTDIYVQHEGVRDNVDGSVTVVRMHSPENSNFKKLIK